MASFSALMASIVLQLSGATALDAILGKKTWRLSVKVGDLVNVRSHITTNQILLTHTRQGILVHNHGDGYYNVVLDNGVTIMTAYANFEVISESR